MNKEKIVLVLALGLLALGAILTFKGWSDAKPFKPPASKDSDVQLKSPDIPLFFADEDDGIEFPLDQRNIFKPVLETVDLPPAVLPAPPLPKAERIAPPPYPEPGYANLSSLAEATPEVSPAKEGTEEGGTEDEGEDE